MKVVSLNSEALGGIGVSAIFQGWPLQLLLVIALLLGGGGAPSPISEFVVEVSAVVLFALFVIRRADVSGVEVSGGDRADQLGRDEILLIALVLLLPIVQLIPLPPALWQIFPGRDIAVQAGNLSGQSDVWRAWSVHRAATFNSLLSLLPPLAVYVMVRKLNEHQRRFLLLAFVVVAFGSIVLAAMQLSSGVAEAYRPFHQGFNGFVSGQFGNRNSYADFVSVALLAFVCWYFSVSQNRRPAAALFVLGAIFLTLATVLSGSRAGMLTLIVPLTCLAVLWTREANKLAFYQRFSVLIGLSITIVSALFIWLALSNAAVTRSLARYSDLKDARPDIWSDSYDGLLEFWPAGSGMGTFREVFDGQERLQTLETAITNRAHNDFLELGVEAGFLGYIVLISCSIIVANWIFTALRAELRNFPFVLFGAGTALIIAGHSIVDYPLRNAAMLCTLALALALLRGATKTGAGVRVVLPEKEGK